MKIRILFTVLLLGSFWVSYGQNDLAQAPDSLYFIQVSASRTYVDPVQIQDQLKIADSLGVIKVKSWYKYFVGAFASHKDAFSHMTENKIEGYVTQYFEGEIVVNVVEAPISLPETIVKEEPKVSLDSKEKPITISADSVVTQEFIPVAEVDTLVIQELPEVIDSVVTIVKESIDSGIFQDKRDNTNYGWVRIGDQVWMTRNLKFKTPFSINPLADSSQGDSYGYLYDFRDAVQICPDGWRLPSDKDWMTLESDLGIENVELRSIGHRSTGYAGISLKSKSDWIEEGNGMDNFGLNILPAGMASKKGDKKQLNQSSHLWSSSKSMFGIWVRHLRFDSPGVLRGLSNKNSFLSIRCIKDTLPAN